MFCMDSFFSGGTLSNELGGGFLRDSGDALEPDVLAPDGDGVDVESSSINPAFSKRLSNDAPTFCPIL